MKKRKMDMEEAGSSTPEDEHDPSENSVSKASNLILEQDRFLPIGRFCFFKYFIDVIFK